MEKLVFKGKINDLTAFLGKANKDYGNITLADFIWLLGLQKEYARRRKEIENERV